MWKNLTVIATAAFFTAAPAFATSFVPYQERCIVDANGHYYVVVKRNDDHEPYSAVTLTIAEQRNGSAPVASAVAKRASGLESLGHAIRDSRIRVREGDIVHGHIDLNQPPGTILVSSSGKGIITLDKYGFNNLGENRGNDDVVIYSLKGEVVHRKSRDALFDETARSYFHYIDGHVAWWGDAWLDEKRDQLVIIGRAKEGETTRRLTLTVGIVSGEVARGGNDVIDHAISERNPLALSDALDFAYEMHLDGSKTAWAGIVDDEKLALGARVRAGVLLASFGDPRGAQLVSKTSQQAANERTGREKDQHDYDVAYAIIHLPEMIGDEALPLLKNTLQASGQTYSFAHVDAFRKLGAKAVPTLVTVLQDDEHFDAQLEAATCLGYLGPQAEPAVPALIKALHKKTAKKWGLLNLRLDSHAAWALEHIGEKAKAAVPDLEQLAKDEDEYARDAARRALEAIRKAPSRP